jgi:hypothetical protein
MESPSWLGEAVSRACCWDASKLAQERARSAQQRIQVSWTVCTAQCKGHESSGFLFYRRAIEIAISARARLGRRCDLFSSGFLQEESHIHSKPSDFRRRCPRVS